MLTVMSYCTVYWLRFHSSLGLPTLSAAQWQSGSVTPWTRLRTITRCLHRPSASSSLPSPSPFPAGATLQTQDAPPSADSALVLSSKFDWAAERQQHLPFSFRHLENGSSEGTFEERPPRPPEPAGESSQQPSPQQGLIAHPSTLMFLHHSSESPPDLLPLDFFLCSDKCAKYRSTHIELTVAGETNSLTCVWTNSPFKAGCPDHRSICTRTHKN